MITPLHLDGVTRTFGATKALDNLSLTLQPGRIYGLVGPNGSGKTTTLRTMLGLILPDRGVVELFGERPNDANRSRVGFVPEKRGLPTTARVDRTLEFVARMRGYSKADARKRAHDWIDRFSLEEKATSKIRTLSNGQQQKVQIALAFLCDPELIILDEPLATLDPEHQELVYRHVRAAAANGATVLLSTHRLHEAETLIHHVIMLAQGKLVLNKDLQTALAEAFTGRWKVRPLGDTGWIDGPDVVSVQPENDGSMVVCLQDGATISGLFGRAAAANAQVGGIEAVLPSLHELYLAHAPGGAIS